MEGSKRGGVQGIVSMLFPIKKRRVLLAGAMIKVLLKQGSGFGDTAPELVFGCRVHLPPPAAAAATSCRSVARVTPARLPACLPTCRIERPKARRRHQTRHVRRSTPRSSRSG